MNEHIRLIAKRIKELRDISGIQAEKLAKELGMDSATLLDYENGTCDIPIGFLYKISQKFGVELTTILSGEDPKLHIFSVVRKGKGLQVERRKQYKYENLAYNFIHKKAEPFMVTIDPVPDSSPIEFNAHPGQEFNYVISGEMKIIINKHEIILQEGDSIYYDSGYEHAMRALSNKPVKMLAIIV